MAEPGWRYIHIQQMRLTAILVSSLWTWILETHPPSFLFVLELFGLFFLFWFVWGGFFLVGFVMVCIFMLSLPVRRG